MQERESINIYSLSTNFCSRITSLWTGTFTGILLILLLGATRYMNLSVSNLLPSA